VSASIETERKFVIAMPDVELISSLDGYTLSEIEQTYLLSSPTVTRRVRLRRYQNRTVYTETKKIRIGRMSAEEDEREISEDEYRTLLTQIAPGTVTLRKTRITFEYSERVFEMDIYPEWQRSCILEVELDREDAPLSMPPFLEIIAEVTGDRRYSNAAMSYEFPKELI
jgi:CYTH domain-containing protein